MLCSPDLLALDLSDKTFVVTGGNSGIGLSTVAQLAAQGARVVLACRRPAEGQRVAARLRAGGSRHIDVAALDLADLDSIRTFSRSFLLTRTALHGLVNNAGVMNTPAQTTKAGFEFQLGINHLGHYLLTELLLPALQFAAPARIVNVSSCYHDIARGREGHIDFDDLHFARRRYDGWEAYAQSKLANVLHARHLARRLAGTGVTTASIHPGWVRTSLLRHSMPLWLQNYLLRPFFRMAGMIEPWEGIQTTLFTLLSPEVPAQSGAYFSQTGMYRDKAANAGGWPMRSPNPQAVDDSIAERLDVVSRALVGLT